MEYKVHTYREPSRLVLVNGSTHATVPAAKLATFFVPNDAAAYGAFSDMWSRDGTIVRAVVMCGGKVVCGGWRAV